MYAATSDFNDVYTHRKLEWMNNFIFSLLFLLILLNIFMVAFYN